MKQIRVLQWGLGAMGSGMARMMLEKQGLKIVAAVDSRPDYVGKDLGDVLGAGRALGVTVTDRPEDVLDKNNVDLVLIATTSWVGQQMPDLRKILNAGINCISIAEEMAAPEAQNPELARELDELAKKNGVTVLGTIDDDQTMVGTSPNGWPWTFYILAEVPDRETVVAACNLFRTIEVGEHRLR